LSASAMLRTRSVAHNAFLICIAVDVLFATTVNVKSLVSHCPSIFVCNLPNNVPVGRFGTNRRATAISPLSCKSFPPRAVPIMRRYARASGESDQMKGWTVSNDGSPLAGDVIVDPDGIGPAVNAK